MDSTRRSEAEAAVRALAAPVLEALGLEVVATRLERLGRRWRLRIDIDRPGPAGVRLDDCERVSRSLEVALEQAGILGEGYVLEVSSPGLDRPIRTDDDVRRNVGRRVVVETREPVGERVHFGGVLLGLAGNDLRIREEDGAEVDIPRPMILKAHQEIDFR